MRRQLKTTGEKVGFAVLVLFWVLALAALSQAARGEELKAAAKHEDTTAATQPPAKKQQEVPAQQSSDGQQITRFILISIPDRQLALVDNGEVVKVYPVAVGKISTPSPEGDFTVTNRTVNPTYYHEGKVIPPGKSNPLGTRWMGLSLKGYGIHGTNAPKSIGKAASHGCIRMAKKDLEELFTLVKVGDAVTIRSERDELVAQVFGGNTDVQVASAATSSADAGNE